MTRKNEVRAALTRVSALLKKFEAKKKVAAGYGDKEKLIGNGVRLTYDTFGFLLEELPAKGKKKLKKTRIGSMAMSSLHEGDLLASNILRNAKVSKSDDYRKMRMKLLLSTSAALEKVGAPVKNYLDGREEEVHFLKVTPEDTNPLEAEGGNFNLRSEWTKFGATEKANEYDGEGMSGTRVVSKSAGGARKLYKLLKAKPDAFKGKSMREFTDFLTKNKIKWDYIFSQWR